MRLLRSWVAATAFGAGLATAGNSAIAQVCVVCAEPSAHYRCVVDNAGAVAGAGAKVSEKAVQYACVSELAQRYRHGSCWVRRDLVGGCDAPEQRISLGAVPLGGPAPAATPDASGTLPTAPAAPAVQAAGAPKPVDAPAPAPGENIPQTMEEVARRAGEASKRDLAEANATVKQTLGKAGEGLEKTGKAVGDAASTTWTCLVSLFTRCK